MAFALAFVTGTVPVQAAQKSRLTSVTIAMGYVADVQFAPFYVAQQQGYYRRAGLQVTFHYGIEPDLLRLAAVGKVDFVNAGGDEVLVAAANGVRVHYILTQYSRFPSAVFALAASGIRRPADLRGHSVGIPGTFGASYLGLLALLQANHLSQRDITVRSIGFNQVQTVAHHKVDAAVGYANNEPIEMRALGYHIREFDIARWANLAGAGLAVGDGFARQHPAVVRAFVGATLQGMRATLRHPDQAFADAERAVPEIRATQARERAVLHRTLDFWRPQGGKPLGWMDPAVWNRTARLLYTFHQIPRRVNAGQVYTNRFIPRT